MSRKPDRKRDRKPGNGTDADLLEDVLAVEESEAQRQKLQDEEYTDGEQRTEEELTGEEPAEKETADREIPEQAEESPEDVLDALDMDEPAGTGTTQQTAVRPAGGRKAGGNSGKKTALIAGGCAVGAALVTAGVFLIVGRTSGSDNSEMTYREDVVTRGPLTVGISSDGSLSIGTTTQSFDLDISAYTGSSSGGFGMMGGGGMLGGGSMGGMMGGSTGTSGSDRTISVADVLVSTGQSLTAGDPILTLEEDSVNSIRSELEADVAQAELALQNAQTSEVSNDGAADTNNTIWTAYGSYAQEEYNDTLDELQTAVDDQQDVINELQDTLNDLQDELAEDNTKLADYKQLLANVEYEKSTYDENDTSLIYTRITAENNRESAQKMVDTIEDEIDDLNDEIKDTNVQIASQQRTLNTLLKEQEEGAAKAKTDYDTKMYYYSSAASYTETSKLQNALNTELAEDDLEEAQQKLDDFDSAIADNQILAKYDGVVETVYVESGDALNQQSRLISYNDYDDITISVQVTEDDLKNISEGDSCVITVDAFPDETFSGIVDDIGDSEYDNSSGETLYTLECLLDSSASESHDFYSGMTSTVTFVTKETRDVLYIPNRAVIRENGQSYVYVKDADGNAVKTPVTTGFSDGTSVEVKDGLTEGQTILIESKVSGS